MADPSKPEEPQARHTPTKRPTRRRWWLAAAGLPLLALAALLLALAALLYQPAALPWALGQIPGLRVEGVQGTISGGDLRIAKLSFSVPDDGGQLQIDGLQMQRRAWQFRPKPGLWLSLHFEALDLARVHWQSGKASTTAPTLPDSLRLPLVLRVDQLRIGTLQIDTLPAITGLQAALSLGGDDGALHRVDDLQLVVEQNQLGGTLALGADAPLELKARLTAARSLAPAWSATLALDGPLRRLLADGRLTGAAPPTGAAPSLSAQATLLPLAAWPLEALNLSTQGLDLSTLSPQWPRTALAGQAKVQSSGLDQPAQVEAELVNSAAGAWDAGLLPLRRLSLVASGEPRQTDRLTVERFELQLADARGDAGSIRGQGRWQSAVAELSLQLDAVQPNRLDRRIAPITLGGPVELRASGLQGDTPQLGFEATLKGRALDGSGLPVQLQLAGLASATQLQLQRAEASAGNARAQATLDARAEAGGWLLRGDAMLDRFDPLPWWPGAADSQWRRGPHRFNGQLVLDLNIKAAAADAIGGTLEQALRAFSGTATLRLADSQLSGMPLAGELALKSGDARYNVDGQFKLAGSQLGVQGRIGLNPAADQLSLTLQAPSLATLAPLGRLLADVDPALAAHWPSAGSVQVEAQADGRWPALRSQGKLEINKFASADATLQQATLDWRAGTGLDDALALQLDARGLAQGAQRIDLLQAKLSGSQRAHQLALTAESPVRPPAWAENLIGPTGTGTRLNAEASGRWQAEPGGSGSLVDGRGGRWLLQNLQLSSGARGLAAAKQRQRQQQPPPADRRLQRWPQRAMAARPCQRWLPAPTACSSVAARPRPSCGWTPIWRRPCCGWHRAGCSC